MCGLSLHMDSSGFCPRSSKCHRNKDVGLDVCWVSRYLSPLLLIEPHIGMLPCGVLLLSST